MKAIANCPKCGKKITTDCHGCIEGNIYGCPEDSKNIHKCSKENIIENVKWKLIPENEKELNELEDNN